MKKQRWWAIQFPDESLDFVSDKRHYAQFSLWQIERIKSRPYKGAKVIEVTVKPKRKRKDTP